MEATKPLVAKMTIDLRRNRFRIFGETLKLLGNPNYIQFLVNPEELFIAILGSDRPLSGGTANKVTLHKTKAANAEFYSSSLIAGIFKIYGALDYRYSYRLTGEVDTVNRVAYFSLRSISRIKRRESYV